MAMPADKHPNQDNPFPAAPPDIFKQHFLDMVRECGMEVSLWRPAVLPPPFNVDESYQRSKNGRQIRRMNSHYNPAAIVVFYIAQRPDGSYWLLDGSQRQELLKLHGVPHVWCMVIQSTGRAFEAKLYQDLFERRGQNAMDKFRADCEARNPEALAVRRLVHAFGFKLSYTRNKEWPNICSANELMRIFNAGGSKVLQSVLNVMMCAWGADSGAVRAEIIGGLGDLFLSYKDIDIGRLIKKVGMLPTDKIRSEAKMFHARSNGKPAAIEVCEILREQYNKGLRNGSRIESIHGR